MFKKLKEKITENSPQRIQQITQSVSSKFQNTTSNENIFSLTDDDSGLEALNSTEAGFTNVPLMPAYENRARKYSDTSNASDVSFLPRYDSSFSAYHLQSDADVSASEVEDNASTSSQVGHLSKEQLYSNFQKTQKKYHKYRGRYTDLARHYKDLEREVSKLKNILVETQDKAIRRSTELKEQCSLEQKAKAHLESVLRDEMDERQMQIEALKTKIDLLQNGNKSFIQAANCDTSNIETLNNSLADAQQKINILSEKMQEMKAKSIVHLTQEKEYKEKISTLEREIADVLQREKDNNLILAQNKMELHNEMLSKESELNILKKENDSIKQTLKYIESQDLNTQNLKLIERIEALTQKCNHLEHEAVKAEQYRMEIETLKEVVSDLRKDDYKQQLEELKVFHESEKQEMLSRISVIREDAKKGLLTIESKIRKQLENEFKEKEDKQKNEFEQRLSNIIEHNEGQKELQMKLLQSEEDLKSLREANEALLGELEFSKEKYKSLEENHLELIKDSSDMRNKLSQLEKQILVADGFQEKISRLQANINTLQEENTNLSSLLSDRTQELDQIRQHEKSLEQAVSKYTKKIIVLQEKQEAMSMESTENKLLEVKIETLAEEKHKFEELFNKHSVELEKLKEEHSKCKASHEKEVSQLKLTIEENEKQHDHSTEEKIAQEKTIAQLENSVKLLQEKLTQMGQLKNESSTMEDKVNELESENFSLKNSLSEEKSNSDFFKKEVEKMNEHVEIERTKRSLLEQELFELKDIKEKLENENKKLLDANVHLEQSHHALKEKIVLFGQKIRMHEMALKECDILEMRVSGLEKSHEQLSNEYAEKDKKLNQVLQQKAGLAEKLEANEKDQRELQKNMNGMKEKLSTYIAQNNEMRNENLRMASTVEEFENKILKLQFSSDEREEQFELTIGNLSSENEKLKEISKNEKCLADQLQLQMKEKKYEMEKVVQELHSTVQNSNGLQKEIENLCQKNKEAHDALESLRKEFDDFVIKSAEEKNILTSEIDNLRLREEQSEVKHKEMSTFTDTISSLQQKLENLEEICSKKESELKILNESLQTLIEERDSLITKCSNLDKECEKFKCENNAAKEDFTIINNKLQNLEQNYLELTQKNQDLQQKITSVEVDSAERETLQKEIEELSEKLCQVEEEKLSLSNNSNVEQLQNELKNSVEKLELLTTQLKNTEADRERMANTNHELSQQNLEITRKLNNVEKEMLVLKLAEQELDNAKIELTDQNNDLSSKLKELQLEVKDLMKQNVELSTKLDQSLKESEVSNAAFNYSDLKINCDKLFIENKSLKSEISKLQKQCDIYLQNNTKYESQINDLEHHYNEIMHEKQLIQEELQELKICPINGLKNFNDSSDSTKFDNLNILKTEKCLIENSNKEKAHEELEYLRDKVTKYKSLDLTNKTSIEFYENELQKLKNKNERLNQRLDETLVTLHHCTELSHSTETEYLKNILYNYMLGKESLVLARVIAAVCKFDPNQTEAILQKEQQKQSLFGQLGLL